MSTELLPNTQTLAAESKAQLQRKQLFSTVFGEFHRHNKDWNYLSKSCPRSVMNQINNILDQQE